MASFLGAATIRAQGLETLGWIALAALVLGLGASAVLLAPWQLKFAVDARELYDELYEQASAEADTDTLGWLAAAGYGYQALREENAGKGSAHVVAVGRGRDTDDRADDFVAGRVGGRVEVHDTQALATAGNQTALDLDRDSRGSWRIGAVTAPAERLDEIERAYTRAAVPFELGSQCEHKAGDRARAF